MNVGIFIRVSTLDQVNNTDSVETHIERGKLYAQAREWNVVNIQFSRSIGQKHHQSQTDSSNV